MKLIQKYTNELTKEQISFYNEILKAVKETNPKVFSYYVNEILSKRDSVESSYVIQLQEMENELALTFIDGLLKKENASIVVSVIAMLNILSKKTIETIDLMYDFKKIESTKKIKLRKLFKNSSKNQIKILEKMILDYDLFKAEIEAKDFNSNLSSFHKAIVSAAKLKFKEKTEENKFYNLVIDNFTEEKENKEIKKILSLSKQEEYDLDYLKENIEKHNKNKEDDFVYTSIDKSCYYESQKVYSEMESLIATKLIYDRTNDNGVLVLLTNIFDSNSKKISMFSKYDFSNMFKCIDLKKKDLIDIIKSKRVLNDIDNSFSAMERYKNSSDFGVSLSKDFFYKLKKIVRNYDNNNLVGTLILLNEEGNYRRNEEYYGLITEADYDTDKQECYATVYIADLDENKSYGIKIALNKCLEAVRLDKTDCTLFYQDCTMIRSLNYTSNNLSNRR